MSCTHMPHQTIAVRHIYMLARPSPLAVCSSSRLIARNLPHDNCCTSPIRTSLASLPRHPPVPFNFHLQTPWLRPSITLDLNFSKKRAAVESSYVPRQPHSQCWFAPVRAHLQQVEDSLSVGLFRQAQWRAVHPSLSSSRMISGSRSRMKSNSLPPRPPPKAR